MIFRSPFADVDVPDVTLPAFALEHAEARGDRPAVIDGPTGRTLAYGDLHRQVRSLAAGLKERGICARGVLAACAPDMPRDAGVFPALAGPRASATTGKPAGTP